MEKEQIKHITENLPHLLKYTLVGTELIAELLARRVLGQDDADKLQLPHLTGIDKASLFYNILMTRHDAFGSLKVALLQTRNTGAFAILDQYCYREYAFPYRNVIIISKDDGILQEETFWKLVTGTFENRKVTVKRRNQEKSNPERIWGEVELLMKLDWHDNIIRYFKTEMSDGHILVALELCKINLEDWLTKSPNKFKIEVNGVDILKQVLDGMEYLHGESTIHGNLDPKNIMVTNPDRNIVRVKIADFALASKLLDKTKTRKEIHLTDFYPKGWSAPEVIVAFEKNDGSTNRRDNTALTGFDLDIFSLGCIFHFVLTKGHHHPFGKDAGTRNGNIKTGNRNISLQLLQHNRHLRFAGIIGKMTAKAERERPAISAIKSDPILWKSTDFANPEHITQLCGQPYIPFMHPV